MFNKPIHRQPLFWILLFALVFLMALNVSNTTPGTWPTNEICMDRMPGNGELMVFSYAECPIGYMEELNGDVYPIQSFRQGVFDPRYGEFIEGPYDENAFSGLGLSIFPAVDTERATLSIQWLNEYDVYTIAAGDELLSVEENTDITACLGEATHVVCLGVAHIKYTYLPNPWRIFARTWVAWIDR